MRIVEGAADGGRPVDLGEGHDLLHVLAQVEPPFRELLMIRRRVRREREEGEEQALVPCLAALVQQRLHVVGVLDILALFVAAPMLGHQPLTGEEPHPLGAEFEREQLAGLGRRHRVAVRLDHDPAAVRRPHRPDQRRIVGRRGQRPQLRPFFLPEQIDWPALRLPVQPHIGHRVQPDPRRRTQRRKVRQLQAGEEVFLDIADPVFNPSFLLGPPRRTRLDREAVVPGKIDIGGIEHRRRPGRTGEHRGLAVVHHDLRRDPAEVFKGVLMAGQPLLLALAESKFEVELPAVAEHQREKTQPPPRVAHADAAPRAPVDLRALAGRKVQGEERRRPRRPHRAHVGFQDRVAPGVTLLPEPGEELGGAVGVRRQKPLDRGLEGIELAHPAPGRDRFSPLVARTLGPRARRLPVQSELVGDLGDRQLRFVTELADLAKGLVVDHRAPPSNAST